MAGSELTWDIQGGIWPDPNPKITSSHSARVPDVRQENAPIARRRACDGRTACEVHAYPQFTMLT